ncbi:MAG: bifunctional DNA-formamidopyrimidine glycosylase/DNA-(apurinic or apyrimidinic site) lyase [Magnetococcales bacterium]|nr:bifunctional DNA-formamidopyrimidine glycosylase/DNA-(apurinic or apyrimidinic site) lyase [Magnetococcales bacterium]
MPELPEVETVRRGLAARLPGKEVASVVVRRGDLRLPVPEAALREALPGSRLRQVERRAKYLMLRFDHGGVLIHLGMTGVLRVVDAAAPPQRHDHLDLIFTHGEALRFTDPRRFGAVLWAAGEPLEHPALAGLGPEPLEPSFNGAELSRRATGRRRGLRDLLLEGRVVAGVGNIYASESLFRARLHPVASCETLTPRQWNGLAEAIREVLGEAVAAGGTTLRDYQNAEGKPGYFQQALRVYGREGEPCPRCGTAIQRLVLAGRGAWYCPDCQPLKVPRRIARP